MMDDKIADKITSIVSQSAPKITSQTEDLISKECIYHLKKGNEILKNLI